MRTGWLAILLTLVMAVSPASAKTFRWAADGAVVSVDPYARNETFLLSFLGNIYEPLVERGQDLKIGPALATSWKQTAPDTWRFALRAGVTFQDGSPFTAEDVLFSLERARQPGSKVAGMLGSIKEARAVDPLTVEFVTEAPDPILPEAIARWYIMSKAWAEANDAQKPADLGRNEDGFATDHANGTGPFQLASRDPDDKTVLTPNPKWWGTRDPSLTRAIYRSIPTDTARVTALVSGEVDMITGVPAPDQERLSRAPGLHLVQGPELRTIFLGMDQWRDELIGSNIKGRNPFKDIRVRRAFAEAIDEAQIKDSVMRGMAIPTALMVGPGVTGFSQELNKRGPFDLAEARRLLSEAGYPDGFELQMDCPVDRYANDEAICAAVVGMLSRIGITVKLVTLPRAKYFFKILAPRYNTSLYMMGWAPTTYDAQEVLINLIATRQDGRGRFNVGGYSNRRIDELIGEIVSELDPEKRSLLIREAFRLHQEEIGHIPLHQQVLTWAARDTIDLVQMPGNEFALRYVRIK